MRAHRGILIRRLGPSLTRGDGAGRYGKTGLIIGAKRMLRIATVSGNDPDGVKDLIRPFLSPCGTMELVDTDFLTSCLWPNNPSLHPPIL